MGKALLIIVLGAGVVLARLAFSSEVTAVSTAKVQAEFNETVIAREIARSGFNTAMAMIRSHGANIDAGVLAVMGSGGGLTGTDRGGEYVVTAYTTSGHSVKVVATGRYGRYTDAQGQVRWRAEHVMEDAYRVPVMVANQLSQLEVESLVPGGAYCAAIYLEQFIPNGAGGYTHVPPRMIFASDNRQQRALRLPIREIIVPGTQLNFHMAVDQSCRVRPSYSHNDTCAWRANLQNTLVTDSRFNYVRAALDVPNAQVHLGQESIWSMIEQHPDSSQVWRIGWEDLWRPDWDNPTSNDPRNSLQATKRLGYYGNGWTQRDANGFRLVRDFGNQPDMEDQLIRVRLRPVTVQRAHQILNERDASLVACNLTPPARPAIPALPIFAPDPDPATDSGSGGSTATAPGPDGSNGITCNCGRGKVGVMHRPPGNEANEHIICIAQPAVVNAHLRNHNDYIACPAVP